MWGTSDNPRLRAGGSLQQCLCICEQLLLCLVEFCGSHGHKNIGFQSKKFQAPTPWVGVLKSGVLNVGSNSWLFREKLGLGSSLPVVWHCAEDELYGKHMSQHFPPVLMEVFLICPLWSHPAGVRISFRAPGVAHWVCLWEEWRSGSSYVVTLLDLFWVNLSLCVSVYSVCKMDLIMVPS